MCGNGQDYAGLLDELERLNGENEQLKARVADLSRVLDRLISYTDSCEGLLNASKAGQVIDAEATLNRTPPQSLGSIKAQTLREYADKNYVSIAIDDFDRGHNQVMWQMRKDAERIEKEAKK